MTNDFIDRLGLPEFMKTCACDGSNVEVVCPTCPYKEECDRMQPFTKMVWILIKLRGDLIRKGS